MLYAQAKDTNKKEKYNKIEIFCYLRMYNYAIKGAVTLFISLNNKLENETQLKQKVSFEYRLFKPDIFMLRIRMLYYA